MNPLNLFRHQKSEPAAIIRLNPDAQYMMIVDHSITAEAAELMAKALHGAITGKVKTAVIAVPDPSKVRFVEIPKKRRGRKPAKPTGLQEVVLKGARG